VIFKVLLEQILYLLILKFVDLSSGGKAAIDQLNPALGGSLDLIVIADVAIAPRMVKAKVGSD